MFEEIVKAAVIEFDENGIRFTMDDVARRMRISKRTLYSHISSKEKLIEDIIELTFGSIKEQEKLILEDTELDVAEKLKKVLCIMPNCFAPIDYRRVHEIKEFYPRLYERIEYHLSAEWENTLFLIQEGIIQGRLRNVKPSMLRQVLLGGFIKLLDKDFLAENNTSYQEAVEELVEIVMHGILEDYRYNMSNE